MELSFIYLIVAALSAIGFTVLIVLNIKKGKVNRQLQSALVKMRNSFNALDEQAKLIVKTDLELNQAQEELDKRLSGLDALQKTSRLISTTLDENEIFQRLRQSLSAELDFEQYIILTYSKEHSFQSKVSEGFNEKEIQLIFAGIQLNQALLKNIIEGHTFSSGKSSEKDVKVIAEMFNVQHFILSPIMSQNGFVGLVFVGNASNTFSITEGDEELVAILANQIGQALQNARLFEEVYLSSRMLETKVQERTKQLESALQEVRQISKMKTEFISAVSHELRTPLTSIKGYASILMAGKLGDVPDPVKERLGKINSHSDSLVQLINNLLDISRIESGRVEMNIKEVSLPEMIDNVHDLLTPQIKDKEINWHAELAPDIPTVHIDPSQYERIFINLISNAIKFTPEQGTISVKAAFDNDIITMTVSDTGIGIAENDLVKLFDEFYRVENKINQSVKGTGLGLPLAKKIVEAHGGKMWVTSEVNHGTHFHFTLPTNTSAKESLS